MRNGLSDFSWVQVEGDADVLCPPSGQPDEKMIDRVTSQMFARLEKMDINVFYVPTKYPNYHELNSRIFTRACIEHRFCHISTYRIGAGHRLPGFS